MLAGTPKTWPDGPSISPLEVLLIFIGVPLLIIAAVYLLAYAPSWVKGPRYRPGQPWQARSEWFGAAVAAQPQSAALSSGTTAEAAGDSTERVAAGHSGAGPGGAQRVGSERVGSERVGSERVSAERVSAESARVEPVVAAEARLEPSPRSGGASVGW